MSLETARPQTAAWRITLWSGLAFAIGTALAFLYLQRYLADDLQNRADSWLTGELGVLSDVAKRTPVDRLHDVVIREVAELASREVPDSEDNSQAMNRAVFFLMVAPNGQALLHTGAGDGSANLAALHKSPLALDHPTDVSVSGFAVPFRVAATQQEDGSRMYLALSTSYELKALRRLRWTLLALWCTVLAFGTAIVFISTRRMLYRVQVIADTASLIGRGNLSSRVPAENTHDEIAHLSSTFNLMLDRVEASVQQLHTMSDSLAHDLRSPMTSMRGKLELALMSEHESVREEAIVSSIEELDRLSTLFSTSLDVSEAQADALRLRKAPLDLEAAVHSMMELYEPSFAQAGLRLLMKSSGPAWMEADAALVQRTVANLLDNGLKHTRPGSTVTIAIQTRGEWVSLLVEDNGDGFPEDLLPNIFERYVKGSNSDGHGLGLAFAAAVARSHNGRIKAQNRPGGGASIAIDFPCAVPVAGTVV